MPFNAYTSKLTQRVAINWAKEGLAACQGMDLLISGVGGQNVARALSEKLQIPLLRAYIFPFTPTSAFPGVPFPQSISKFGSVVNRLSHHLMRQIMWQGFRKADRLAREQVFDLPAAPFFGSDNLPQFQQYPTLYGFSPSVIPKPADWHNTEVTGYWFLNEAADWTPPAELIAFLQAGPPPVYIGFGSMGSRKPEETADLVLQAIALLYGPAIVQSKISL